MDLLRHPSSTRKLRHGVRSRHFQPHRRARIGIPVARGLSTVGAMRVWIFIEYPDKDRLISPRLNRRKYLEGLDHERSEDRVSYVVAQVVCAIAALRRSKCDIPFMPSHSTCDVPCTALVVIRSVWSMTVAGLLQIRRAWVADRRACPRRHAWRCTVWRRARPGCRYSTCSMSDPRSP